MRKFTFLFLFMVAFACSDIDAIKPEDVFIKYYGPESLLELKDMVMAVEQDGSVILAGDNTSNWLDQGIEEKNLYIVKVDPFGNITNEHEFPGTTFGANESLSKIAVIDGGYLVISTWTRADGVNNIIYAELDQDLNPVNGSTESVTVGDGTVEVVQPNWQIVSDANKDMAEDENLWAADIATTEDGGIVVAGHTDVNGSNDYYYEKIGGTNDAWSRIQTRAGSDDQMFRLIKTGTNFVLVGQTEALSDEGEGGINIERTVIDQEGVIINSAIYGITSTVQAGRVQSDPITDWDDIPLDIVEKPGGYTIVGSSSLDGDIFLPFFMNVDLTGASTTEKIYVEEFGAVQTGIEGFATSVTYSVTNDPIIVGRINDFPDRSNEMMIMRTDQKGSLIGDILNKGLVNGNEQAVKVLIAPDGSILIGATYDFGGNISQYALLNFNNDLELKK